ncbi:pentapeptide repeat-containing protein [Micromonospora sp. NPDC047707]|uniref:NACHT domain-containing protein n=1 Tax=Micromonospora sp. NPDC047707 TaxID=3154498 RepID=UPI0034511572
MLEHWARVDEFPFTVQVWSPQSGVRELFSLAPDIYEALYGAAPDGSEPPPETVVDTIRGRLAPHLRLAQVWRDYLRKPARHCIGSEKPDHFDELMKNHVDIKATDVSGSILEGTLMDRVLAWLNGPDGQALLLLADFGEGKSFFTYNLSRRLCDAFLADSTHGVMPLRIPLGQFKAARDGRRLLERRLGEIGATLADWRDLTASTRCLVVLDGFDEMSTDLSQEAMEDNIAGLESCLEELTGSQVRIVVTSRGRAFDVGRNRERILDRLGQPQILQFSPVPRADRIRYLEGFVDDPTGEQRLATLRGLYDPIGLAAKPLFLQMIRETLTDLPDGKFSELILYRTYVRKSLSRKLEYLRASRVTDSELVDNLLRILEKIAVKLQRTDQQYVYLTDVAGPNPNLAQLLWQTRDGVEQASSTGDDVDAAARIGIRSLLKAAPAPDEGRWPVTFFHRSMQEYFVACALVRALRDNHELARTVLDDLPPLPEIVHFAASMIRELRDRASVWGVLESFTRSATVSIRSKYLGGHAVTLLHISGGIVPKADCSRLRLDYANLDGVDLSGARLVDTSLRDANLDNANLENADLTGADLEGVRLEETSSVVGLTALGNDQIAAAYDDRSIRAWRRKPGGQWSSRIVGSANHNIERIQMTPGGRLLVSGGSVLSVFSLSSPEWICDNRFPTKPPLRPPVAGVSTALYEQELPGGRTQVVWMHLQTLTAHYIEAADEPAVCYAQLDNRAFAVASESSVRLTTPVEGRPDFTTVELGLRNVNCIDMRTSPDDSILLACGHRDGVLTLAASKSNYLVERWRVRRHDAMVNSIVFADDDNIISGGIDRSVRVTPIATGEAPEGDPIMRLTLRCAGVRYDGVRTERERLMLATAASSEPAHTSPD